MALNKEREKRVKNGNIALKWVSRNFVALNLKQFVIKDETKVNLEKNDSEQKICKKGLDKRCY